MNCNLYAQPDEFVALNDSISIQDTTHLEPIAASRIIIPRKATIYSAVLPGLGQVYNKQWWKVPFFYGGFVTLGYFINSYNKGSSNALNAYHDLKDRNPKTNSYTIYENILYEGEINETNVDQTLLKNIENELNDKKDKRDQYIVYTAFFYLFNILDANVSAHLIDFDISEDLSLNFQPIAVDPITNTPIFGATFSYNF